MHGYGGAVVLRHTTPVPGLPSPFFTSYNHLSAFAPGIAPGVAVAPGTLLGNVGNTTNGQFAGMGSHLHMELRRLPFPGPVGHDGYELDTMDPSLLFAPLGIDWLDSRRELGRGVGGHLYLRAGGPSDPAVCGGVRGLGGNSIFSGNLKTRQRSVSFLGLEGLDAYLGELGSGALGYAPAGYVDPVRIVAKYTTYGTTQVPRVGSPAADVMPPDYAAVADGSSSGSGGSGLVIGGTIAALLAWRLLRRS
jgi:hypothetical protein